MLCSESLLFKPFLKRMLMLLMSFYSLKIASLRLSPRILHDWLLLRLLFLSLFDLVLKVLLSLNNKTLRR